MPDGFNTQPPEGGWGHDSTDDHANQCFNTQPPEGGWGKKCSIGLMQVMVSTHSRLKAAGVFTVADLEFRLVVSTHSRLKAAGV